MADGRRFVAACLTTVLAFAGSGSVAGGVAGAATTAVSRVDANAPLPIDPAPEQSPTVPSGDFSSAPPGPDDALTSKAPISAGEGFDPQKSVVDASLTTEDRQVFANPDGSKTVEVSSGAVRFKGDDGAWRRFDLRLQPAGHVAKDAPGVEAVRVPGVVVSDTDLVARASDRPEALSTEPKLGLARVATPAGIVTMGQPDVTGDLSVGAPAKDDASTLEFASQLPGVAVQVRLATNGFEQLMVLDSASGPSEYAVPLLVPEGMTARDTKEGTVEFLDSSGASVGSFRGGSALDFASRHQASTPVNVKLLDQSRGIVHVGVAIDAKWLADSDRVFPVTIDPGWLTTTPIYGTDTYMSTSAPSTSKYGSCFNGMGNFSNGAEWNRTYIAFAPPNLPGWDPSYAVWGASIGMFNYNGWTQSAATMRAYPVTQFVFPSLLTWNVQPTVDNSVPSSISIINGGGSAPAGCGAPNGGGSGWNYIDATPLVRQQLTTGNPSWGVGFLITADDENDTSTGKNFYSTEHANQSGDGSAPYLRVTYKHMPTATSLVSPVDQAKVATVTPSLTATSSTSPDGDGPMKYQFQVATGADGNSGTVVYNSGFQALTPSGGQVSWSVPAGYLQNGGIYHWTVRAFDGYIWNNWAVARTLKVDLRLGASGPSPFDKHGPVNVNLASGNLNFTTSSQSMTTVGGRAGVTYSYNSRTPTLYGLTGDYYNNQSWTGDPVAERRDSTMSFNWGTQPPVGGVTGATWSAKWTGSLTVPATSTMGGTGNGWGLAVSSHAGVQVKINGTSVYNTYLNPGAWNFGTWQYGNFTQAANTTSQIEISLFSDSGGAAMDVRLFPSSRSFNPATDPPVQGDWLKIAAPPLPTGWDLSADDGEVPYTHIQNTGTSAALTTADGQVDSYASTIYGYFPEPGQTGHLAFNWSANALGWDFTDAGWAEHFGIDGNLLWAFNASDDRHPAGLQYVYSSVGSGIPVRLTSIKDPVSNRSILLRYSGDTACQTPPSGYASAPGGMLCRVDFSQWSGGYNDLFYVSGQLAMLRGAGSSSVGYDTTLFGYTGGVLSSIESPQSFDEVNAGVVAPGSTSQVTTNILYTSGRVAIVTLPEPAPTSTPNANSRQIHTYNYTPATSTSTVQGVLPGPTTKVIRTVTWDPANLDQLTDKDATGHLRSQTWDLAADAVSSVTDAAGLMTATTRDEQHRPTDVYGPAPTSWFNGLVPAAGHGDGEANPMPHAHTDFDGGIIGLAATWYNSYDLSGNPVTHSLWNGDGTNATQNWSTGAPAPGVSSDAFSGVFTGEVKIPFAGAAGTNRAQFQLFADDGAQLYVDDQLVISKWGAPADPNGGSNPLPFDTAQDSWHRIRILFQENAGGASFALNYRKGNTGAFTTVPTLNLTPRYDLPTLNKDPDGHTIFHTYSGGGVGPQNGLEYQQIADLFGLGLTTTNTYEPASTGTYFRQLSHTLPRGAATAATDTYYGATETRTFPTISGCPSGTASQAGLAKLHTDATPAVGPAATTETIYNDQGRPAFSRQTGDGTNWECTAYDQRLRVVFIRDTSGKTSSFNYSVPGTATVTYTDSAGNSRTTVTKTDLLGREIYYADEQGAISTTDYDVAGRVADTWRQLPAASNTHILHKTYDDDGRELTTTEYVSIGTGRTFTTSYDAVGRPFTLDRPTDTNATRTTTNYDPNTGRLLSLSTVRNGTTFWTDVYGYTLGGNVSLDWSTAAATSYGYDTVGRLKTAGPRSYAYDADTNRCALATNCATPTYSYDSADRLVSSPVGNGYQYDNHGNLTGYTKTGVGPVVLMYDANDHCVRTDDGTTRTDETLSPSGRVLRRKVTSPPGGTVTEDIIYGYDDNTDSPAWARPAAGGTVTTYLGGEVVVGTTPTYQIGNAHGDVVGTVNQAGGFSASPATDEFGVTTGAVPATRLGWLGMQLRFTTARSLGIVRMGVRLYDPNLGRFLQRDPIVGGSCNSYDYECQDPLNGWDLDGTYSRHHHQQNHKPRHVRSAPKCNGAVLWVFRFFGYGDWFRAGADVSRGKFRNAGGKALGIGANQGFMKIAKKAPGAAGKFVSKAAIPIAVAATAMDVYCSTTGYESVGLPNPQADNPENPRYNGSPGGFYNPGTPSP